MVGGRERKIALPRPPRYFSRPMRLAPLVAAAALAGSPAFAAVPEKGEGTITPLGGARILIPGNGAYLDEQGAAHRPPPPAASTPLRNHHPHNLPSTTNTRHPS